jgi:hypothetical protein
VDPGPFAVKSNRRQPPRGRPRGFRGESHSRAASSAGRGNTNPAPRQSSQTERQRRGRGERVRPEGFGRLRRETMTILLGQSLVSPKPRFRLKSLSHEPLENNGLASQLAVPGDADRETLRNIPRGPQAVCGKVKSPTRATARFSWRIVLPRRRRHVSKAWRNSGECFSSQSAGASDSRLSPVLPSLTRFGVSNRTARPEGAGC